MQYTSCELLSIVSYNSRGLSDNRQSVIKELLSINDIVFIQEHWLYNDQLHHLYNISDSHMCHASSGMEMDVIHQGRPYGGCAIFWKKNLCKNVEMLKSYNNRIVGVKLHYEDASLLLLNVYMPCNRGNDSHEFIDTLDAISNILREYDSDLVLFGGDFNTDFNRKSIQTDTLRKFIDDFSFYNCFNKYKHSTDYTYINRATGATSHIDHLFVTHNLIDCIECINIDHRGDNFSDHDPLQVKIKIPISRLQYKKKQSNKKTKWNRASESQIDNYSSILDNFLKLIEIPFDAVHCMNLKCNCKKHLNDIDRYCNDIVKACLEASNITIPVSKSFTSVKAKPGWNEHCESLRQSSIFWHHIWLECGRPHNGQIANVMRNARARYHYAVRWLKRNENQLRNEKLASDLINNRTRDYWSEIKAIKGNNRCVPLSMDNEYSDSNIADIFANKYEKLYNSIGFDNNDMDLLKDIIDSKIDNSELNLSSCNISVNDVDIAVKSLNKGKSDGASDLTSDHIINGCKSLNVHISMLLSSMLKHGASPNILRTACMIPIPKNKKGNLCDSNNYRAIALISCISKIFDLIILNKYNKNMATSDMQFGFKDGCSTNTCTFVMKETISYYVNNGSHVYAAFLDATKAFDRINYCRLFKLLLKREIPPCIIRLIMTMYTNQQMFVKWNDSISKFFDVSNGVKQGGVLSPILFCIYVDELLCELRKSGYGCYIGNTYCGCLGYADDITLLSPSVAGLQKLLNICENFASKNDIQFNESKSKVMVFCNKIQNNIMPNLYLNDRILEFVKKFVHLGHIITTDINDEDDIKSQRGKFVGKANAIISDFKGVNSVLKHNVLKTYCYSFYGSQLWDLQNKVIETLCVSWRRACKKAMCLPQRTHTRLLSLVCDNVPLLLILYKRFIKFYKSCHSSNNAIVSFISQNCLYVSKSSTSNNLKHLHYLFSIPYEEMINKSFSYLCKKIDNTFYDNIGYLEKLYANIIKECLSVCDGLSVSCLNIAECHQLIDYLCII